jgi:hypothetical protein
MKDDQRYLELMALYRRLRLIPGKPSTKEAVLNLALKVKREGQVSEEAKEAAKYL